MGVKLGVFPTPRGHPLLRWTQTFNSSYQDEGRTYNREFSAMLADEHVLIFGTTIIICPGRH